MKNNILLTLLCFICLSCSNYKHIPKKINKTSDKGREGLWIIASDSVCCTVFVHYKAGIKHGKYKEYFANGQTAVSGRYRNGKEIHLWKFYFGDGSLIKKINYGGCVFCRRSVLINYAW